MGILREVYHILVYKVKTTWEGAEFNTIELKVIAGLQTPVHQITLRWVKRSMEDSNYILGCSSS
jgi:hypothetical protein